MANRRQFHALATDGVNLVDENDARRLYRARGEACEHSEARRGGGTYVLASRREQFAHTRGAQAHQHFLKLRRRARVERDLGFACDGTCQQRLAGAGRASEEDTARDLAAELRVLLGVLLATHAATHR